MNLIKKMRIFLTFVCLFASLFSRVGIVKAEEGNDSIPEKPIYTNKNIKKTPEKTVEETPAPKTKTEEKSPGTAAPQIIAAKQEALLPAPAQIPTQDLAPKSAEKPIKKLPPAPDSASNLQPEQQLPQEENKEAEPEQRAFSPELPGPPQEPIDNRSESEKRLEEVGIILPNASADEISPTQTITHELPDNEENHKNVIKSIIAWVLILVGLFIIVKVIISNRKIPSGFEPNFRSNRTKRKKRKEYF